MEMCITPLPDVKSKTEVAGGELAKFPARVNAIPPRIASGSVPSVTADNFREDSTLWVKRIKYYKGHLIPPLTTGRYRNIMDMNAGLGGFAAALVNDPVWVMNAMPPEAKVDTLGVIYERGFIGTYQNWYIIPPSSTPLNAMTLESLAFINGLRIVRYLLNSAHCKRDSPPLSFTPLCSAHMG